MSRNIEVKHRKKGHARRYQTSIWSEEASAANPFIAQSARCRGYALDQLIDKVSYVDMLYLMYIGELPDPESSKLLERALIAFSNPGVRHEATRAAINAGVGKTLHQHVLPISLLIMSGEYNGAALVEPAMQFFYDAVKQSPEAIDLSVAAEHFGLINGSQDELTNHMAFWLAESAVPTPILDWAQCLQSRLAACSGEAWLRPTLAAAVLCDLGMPVHMGAGFYQLMCAPGLLCQGMEHADSSTRILPFVSDEDYSLCT